MSPRTIVVGGGLAGLLAARRLQRAGRRVTLLESAEDVGGAIGRATVAGIPVNTGAEGYGTSSGAVDALLADLGLSGSVVAPRSGLGSGVVSDAGFHRSPEASLLGIPGRPLAADVRAVLGVTGSLRAAAERFLPAGYGMHPEVSIGEITRRRLGRRVAQRLVAPVIGGVHSADPDSLEFAAAAPRLLEDLRRHGSLTAAVRRLAPRGGSAGTRVHALAPTMALLPEALAEQIRAAGGEIRTGVTATSLGRQSGTWTVHVADGEELAAEHLVLAGPPDTARALLSDAAPAVAEAIPQAPSSAVRLVVLVLDAPALDAFPAGTGALVAPHTPGIRAKALTHATAKWEHLQQAARRQQPQAAAPHVVRLSYGRPGEDLPDPGGVVEAALADTSRMLATPIGRTQLLDAIVIDWPHAMRRAQPGHRAALDAVTDRLRQEPSLELVGSWRAGTGIDAIVRADAAASAARPPTPSHAHHPTPEGHRS